MKSTHRWGVLPGLLLSLALSTAAPAEPLDGAITIGQRRSMWSETLQEERRLFISLPAEYGNGKHAYPVLVVLDGGSLFMPAAVAVPYLASPRQGNELMPEMIVVGVPNTYRNRDLTPPSTNPEDLQDSPGAGHAEAFLKYLNNELVPWVNQHYRTEPYRILAGHSYGGLLVIHALSVNPESFNAYVAISPSLWWDRGAPAEKAVQQLRRLPARRSLFVSWATGEEDISVPAKEMVTELESQPIPNLALSHRFYPGDDHLSTAFRGLYEGLETIFAGWRVPTGSDLSFVQAHFARLSSIQGYQVRIPGRVLDEVAHTMLARKDTESALVLMQRTAEDYPEYYGELGEALEELGRREEARAAYTEGLEYAIDSEATYADEPAVATYRTALKRLEEKRKRR